MKKTTALFWKIGEPYVWISSATLTLILAMTVILLVVIMKNGLGVFWPQEQVQLTMKDASILQGAIMQREKQPLHKNHYRIQLKTGNRDLYGMDFRWVNEDDIASRERPADLTVFERKEYGIFVGYVESIQEKDGVLIRGEAAMARLPQARKALSVYVAIQQSVDDRIMRLSRAMQDLRHTLLRLEYRQKPVLANRIKIAHARYDALADDLNALMAAQAAARNDVAAFTITLRDAAGTTKTRPLHDIVRAYQPNRMGAWARAVHYFSKIKELLTDDPRESNTEGGLYPAIFGTVVLVFLMSIFSFPLGLMAGIYLREYAKDNWIVRVVRIAVNNLAGVPSIVYGIFGLGFFVYGIGGFLDSWLYPERLPEPTFGTGGILWASLTLGLLTIPVVIVSTEEAFGSIPRGVREASLAMGATRFQTLVRVLLPMASPGIMTGFLLAIARAAGEVAPLMITGVVKLAPALPFDGAAPYVHLERKFMHLGFHIFDIGFQSPNVEAAKPMVFVTALLLILIVLLMSSLAIWFRESMKRKHSMRAH
ncbi:MAG: phosphate ABC transporter permease PstA [Verrucomicrobia bacterium]|nr:phosphate ABC transporter permease PstA [Verrucomicrobiota bacterium]